MKKLAPDSVGFTPNGCSREQGQIDVEATAEVLDKFDRESRKYDSNPKANQSKNIEAIQVTGTK